MINYKEVAKKLLIFLILVVSFIPRYQLLSQQGDDFGTYLEAMEAFTAGNNPYTQTLETFKHLDTNPGDKGYAYLPGFLYIYSFIYVVIFLIVKNYQVFYTPEVLSLVDQLWKIPTYLADLGIGILLIKSLYKKSYIALVFALVIWYFNPYFWYKRNYITSDPVTIFFMLLSLYYINKDKVISGTTFALAVIFKSFPILLLPIYLINCKSLKEAFKFIGAGIIMFLFISLPFILKGPHDFMDYLKGALLVHGERFVQGRPYLYYISYYYKIEFFQIIPFKLYTYLASFSGWLVVTLIWLKFKYTEKYSLSIVPFLTFYLFTPVLNTTYTVWFLPVFILGLFELFQKRFKWAYYVILLAWYAFMWWYLVQWKQGFHIWHPV